MAPSRVPVQIFVRSRTELRNSRQRDAGYHPSDRGVEALPGRGRTQIRDLDRPQKLGIFHVGQEAQPPTSPVVPDPRTVRLYLAPSPGKEYGEAGCFVQESGSRNRVRG